MRLKFEMQIIARFASLAMLLSICATGGPRRPAGGAGVCPACSSRGKEDRGCYHRPLFRRHYGFCTWNET